MDWIWVVVIILVGLASIALPAWYINRVTGTGEYTYGYIHGIFRDKKGK